MGDATSQSGPFSALVRAIVAADADGARSLLNQSPTLAHSRVNAAARDRASSEYFLKEIGRQVYGGDSALHIAAAAHDAVIARQLLACGADVHARNRHGQSPLHYAVLGAPGSSRWNPKAQVATIRLLIEAGAEPNGTDRSGVTPLHRAVRTRSSAAVDVLLKHGADPNLVKGNGSTPMRLALLTTGRGGAGTPEAKAEQARIVEILQGAGAR